MALSDLSKKCSKIAKELQIEVWKLSINHDDRRRTMEKACRFHKEIRKLKVMRAKLDELTRALDILIVIRLDTQTLMILLS